MFIKECFFLLFFFNYVYFYTYYFFFCLFEVYNYLLDFFLARRQRHFVQFHLKISQNLKIFFKNLRFSEREQFFLLIITFFYGASKIILSQMYSLFQLNSFMSFRILLGTVLLRSKFIFVYYCFVYTIFCFCCVIFFFIVTEINVIHFELIKKTNLLTFQTNIQVHC